MPGFSFGKAFEMSKSANRVRRSAKGWGSITKELDICREFSELGVEIVQDHPTPKGYVACWAYDRPHGDSPSAGINVNTGWYRDHGGSGDGLYLYELRHRIGIAATVEDSLKYYAIKAGKIDELSVELHARAYAEQNVETFGWQSDRPFGGHIGCHTFFDRYPGISAEILGMAGVEYAAWPKNSPEPNYCLAFRSYDSDFNEMGYVLQSISRRGLVKYQGPDRPPQLLNRIVLGSSGMLNRHGLNVARSEECQLIIKTEGVSDMLAVQSLIPEELRGVISVVTNACGCRDIPAHALGFFRGKRVVVLHDSDVPGQEGAVMWCNALLSVTPHVKNLLLFEEISPDHGRDARDWIADGGTWEQLRELIEACPTFSPNPEDLTPEQIARMSLGPNATDDEIQDHLLLNKLGLLVLGHEEEDGSILCFSQFKGKQFHFPSASRIRVEDVITRLGSVVCDTISMGDVFDPTKHSMSQLRRAIAWKASSRTLGEEDQIGQGIWLVGDKIVLVNDTEISVANGQMVTSKAPIIDGKIIQFAKESWYDNEEIESLYGQTLNRHWCRQVFDDVGAVFARWDNWKQPDTPLILTAMVCSTWIQTTLDFRPGVVVTGPSNSGKTFLNQECISKMFGRMALFVAQPTEAGLRQAIGRTSRVLMIDEFENSAHRQKILEVLRSSTRGVDIVKGSANHKVTRFHFRHIPWLSSIETGLNAAADRNRYIVLELNQRPRGSTNTLRVPPVEELEMMGKKLMVIGMRYHAAIRNFHVELKATPITGIDLRIVEAFSLPAAVLGAVIGLTLDESRELLRASLERRFSQDDFDGESDEAALLEAIGTVLVRTPHGEFTVAKLLQMFSFETLSDKQWADRTITPESCLNSIGIKRTRLNDGRGDVNIREADGVAVALRTFCSKLKGTRFEGMNIGEILVRLPGARKTRIPFNKQILTAAVIPLGSILESGQSSGSLFQDEPLERGDGVW